MTFAQNGSFGATTSLFLRGGESKYVKVLVDDNNPNLVRLGDDITDRARQGRNDVTGR